MKSLLKKVTLGASLGLLCLTSFISNANIIKTDIIFVVDESGSMGNVQVNLRNNIAAFASQLNASGVDASYGLVGYGDGSVVPNTLTDLTDPASFATAAQGLIASGGTEPAYDAIAYALNENTSYPDPVNPGSFLAGNFSFRNDAVTNIILLTDEPHNGSTFSYATIDAMLKANNALFNLVSYPGPADAVINGGSLSQLASNNGGQTFDLGGLNSNDPAIITAFVTAFAQAKAIETRTFCQLNPTDPACQNVNPVPAPAGIVLLATGILGLVMRRRFAA